MKPDRSRKKNIAAALGIVALCLAAQNLPAQSKSNTFLQTNLVSDLPGMAIHTDADLVNPWGISSSSGSPFWVSDNGTGVSTLYNTFGVKQGLVVSMPSGSEPVTGQVFNASTDFNNDKFIFANEAGTITGWRGALGTTAEVLTTINNGELKGLAIGNNGTGNYIYAADFKNNAIDVLKGNAGDPNLAGNFIDPALPAGYAPFNVQNLNGKLFVTYAVVGPTGDDVAGPGNGIVDTFDLNGNFLQRLVSNGALNSPWGLAIAPAGFGPFEGDLLVGNFGNGWINAFDPTTGDFVGSLDDRNGNPIVIDGLWGIKFGNGGSGGDTNNLYFAAGIAGPGETEDHGLFGSLSHVPETGSTLLLVTGALAAFLGLRRQMTKAHQS
jgi:uncharacterized protein (TIGR03118 family)